MKNQTLTIVGGIAAVIIGFGVYRAVQNSPGPDFIQNSPQSDAAQSSPQSDSMMEKDAAPIPELEMADSRYLQYSKSVLDSASGSRRVLFFYASWCPTCKQADASFAQNLAEIPEDVTLIRINYNDPDTDQEEKDLAKEYGITYQHTFVQIDATGEEVVKWNGGQMKELLSNIK